MIARIARRAWLPVVAISLLAVPAIASLTVPTDIGFKVLREGSSIGRHEIKFQRSGDDLIVDVEIDLEVSLAFITFYEYRHRNREVWRNDRLVSIATDTDDNGDVYRVRGKAVADGFRVETNEKAYLAPASVVPTSYWNRRTVEQSKLLDTQNGRLVPVTLTRVGSETVQTPVGPRSANRYTVTGLIDLELWYEPDWRLAKIRFRAPKDGSVIDYRPAS